MKCFIGNGEKWYRTVARPFCVQEYCHDSYQFITIEPHRYPPFLVAGVKCSGHHLREFHQPQRWPHQFAALGLPTPLGTEPCQRTRACIQWSLHLPDYVTTFLADFNIDHQELLFFTHYLISLGDSLVRHHPMLVWCAIKLAGRQPREAWVAEMLHEQVRPMQLLEFVLREDGQAASKAKLRALQKIAPLDDRALRFTSDVDQHRPLVTIRDAAYTMVGQAYQDCEKRSMPSPIILTLELIIAFLGAEDSIRRINHIEGTLSLRLIRLAHHLPAVLSHPLIRQATMEDEMAKQDALGMLIELLQENHALSPHRLAEWPSFNTLAELSDRIPRPAPRPYQAMRAYDCRSQVVMKNYPPTLRTDVRAAVRFMGFNPTPSDLTKWGFQNCLTRSKRLTTRYRERVHDGSGILAVFQHNQTTTLGYMIWSDEGTLVLAESQSVRAGASGTFPVEVFIGATELCLYLMHHSATPLKHGQILEVDAYDSRSNLVPSHNNRMPMNHAGQDVIQRRLQAITQIRNQAVGKTHGVRTHKPMAF